MSRVRSVGAWGPSTGPTACAIARRRCSLWGWRKNVPGGGAVCCCEGRQGSGAPPPPAAPPLGGLSGSATHVLSARMCGRGGPAPAPWPACPCGGLRATRGGVRRMGSGTPSSLLPALWAGCRRPLATCCGHGCGCVRCVWCLCGVCRGAWCRLSPVPLVLPSPVLRCGVVPAVCRVPAVLPPLRASLARLLATPCFFLGFVALYRSLPFPLLALLPCMHFFPASALVFVSVLFLAGSSFPLVGPCERKGGWGYVALRWLAAVAV